jgi:hypothetical protein
METMLQYNFGYSGRTGKLFCNDVALLRHASICFRSGLNWMGLKISIRHRNFMKSQIFRWLAGLYWLERYVCGLFLITINLHYYAKVSEAFGDSSRSVPHPVVHS